jgi:alpha-1,2-mannosyltransferase
LRDAERLGTRSTGSRKPDRAGGSVIALALAAGVLCMLAVCLHSAATHDQIDFAVYRAGGRAILHGHDLYALRVPPLQLGFTYPPASAAIFVPLAFGPLRLDQVVWISLSLVGLYLYVRLVLRRYAAGIAATSIAVAVLVFLVVATSDPLRVNFHLGQINVLIALLICADFSDTFPRVPRGVMTGIAAALKLTPLFLVFYLVAVRRYRTAAVAAITFAGVTLTAWSIAAHASAEYWLRGYFADARRTGDIGYISNQSLNGVLVRLTGSPEHARAIWLPVAVVVAGFVLWQTRRIHQRRPWLAEAVALAAMLLLSPVSWIHHWILVLPLLVACFRLFSEQVSLRRVGLALTVALSASLWFGLVWKVPNTQHRELHLSAWQLVVGDSAFILLVATLGVAIAAARADRRDRASELVERAAVVDLGLAADPHRAERRIDDESSFDVGIQREQSSAPARERGAVPSLFEAAPRLPRR